MPASVTMAPGRSRSARLNLHLQDEGLAGPTAGRGGVLAHQAPGGLQAGAPLAARLEDGIWPWRPGRGVQFAEHARVSHAEVPAVALRAKQWRRPELHGNPVAD